MNLADILSNEKLRKKLEKIESYTPDPYLKIFGFERKVAFFEEEKVWAYSAGFSFKRENEKNAIGQFHFFYYPNESVYVTTHFYDETINLTEEENNQIINSIQTHSRYCEMINSHQAFFQELNKLFVHKMPFSQTEWKKQKDSFESNITIDGNQFNILINVSIKNEQPELECIQISQEDEDFYKYVDISTILKSVLPAVYKKWIGEILSLK